MSRKICLTLVVQIFCIYFTFSQDIEQNRSLQLKGFDVQSEQSLQEFLSERHLSNNLVWIGTHIGQTWSFYNEKFPLKYKHQLKTIKPGIAYWIMSKTPIKANSTPQNHSFKILKPGYSLLYPSVSRSISLSQALNPLTVSNANYSDIEELWTFNPQDKQFEYYSHKEIKPGFKTIESINENQGYWIKTKVSNLVWNPSQTNSPPLLIEGGGLSTDRINQHELRIKELPSTHLSKLNQLLEIKSGEIDQLFDFNFDAQSFTKKALGQLKIKLRSISKSGAKSSQILFDEVLASESLSMSLPFQFQENGLYTINLTSKNKDISLHQKEVKIYVNRAKTGTFFNLFHKLGQSLPNRSRSSTRIQASQVSTILVTISGDNLQSYTQEFSGLHTQGNISVPVGTNRRFVIEFKDPHGDVIRKGQIDLDLLSNTGQTTTLTPIAIDLGIPELTVNPEFRQFAGQMEINLSFSNGTIFYTSDGTNPKNSNTVLNSASPVVLNISDTTNIKAYLQSTNGNKGPVHEFLFERTNPPSVSAIPSGTQLNQSYLNQVDVAFSSDVTGSKVYYTIDGSTPDLNSSFGIIPFSRSFHQSIELNYFAQTSGGVQSSIQSTGILVLNTPDQLATQLQFQDTDFDSNQISGTLSFFESNNDSSVTNYLVYYGDTNGNKLASGFITSNESGASFHELPFSVDTPLPSGATHFLVYSLNAAGESTNSASIAINDLGTPTILPQDVSLTNLESHPQKISGTLQILKANNEDNIDSYKVYFGNSVSDVLESELLVTLNKTGQNLSYEIPDDTVIPNGATYIHVRSVNQYGEHPLSISEPIDFTISTPSASILQNQSIFTEDTAFFSAGSSIAPEGRTLDILWTVVSAPSLSTASIVGSKNLSASIKPNLPGNYVIQLKTSVIDYPNIFDTSQFIVAVVEKPGAPASPYKISSADHSCALFTNKDIKCWGPNSNHRLGLGDDTDRAIATIVPNVKAIDVATGSYHTCLVNEDHTVSCVGQIPFSDSHSTDHTSTQYSLVPNLENIVNLSSGNNFSCALNQTGEVYCFGTNNNFQTAKNNLQASAGAIKVEGLSSIRKIDSGVNHTCALDKNGDIFCFGNGANGQLGNGRLLDFSHPQKLIKDQRKVIDFSLGDSSSCFLFEDNTVSCTGNNDTGQLGTGNYNLSNTIQETVLLDQVTQLSSKGSHTCALKQDRTVWCFGQNTNGQLGNGDFRHSSIPQQVKNLPPVVFIEAGNSHSCTIDTQGVVQCFGNYSENRLANNLQENQSTPALADGFVSQADTKPIANAGLNHTESLGQILLSGIMSFEPNAQALTYTWEIITRPSFSTSELVNTNLVDSSFVADEIGVYRIKLTVDDGNFQDTHSIDITVQDMSPSSVTLSNFDISSHYCAIVNQGDFLCAGNSNFGETGNLFNHSQLLKIDTSVAVDSFSLSDNHSCYIDTNQEAYCFGKGEAGQLGNNSVQNSSSPTKVNGLTQLSQISAGDDYTCALNKNGEVYCFGNNAYGRAGLGILNDSKTPIKIDQLKNIEQIATGIYHTCALNNRGNIYCFGYGTYGQFGNGRSGDSIHPVQFKGSGFTLDDNDPDELTKRLRFKNVQVGEYFTCALGLDQHVYCAGDNSLGQLGVSQPSASTKVLQVPLKKLSQQISLGQNHACAKHLDNSVSCWGDNSKNQILPTQTNFYSIPIQVQQNISFVRLGKNNTCFIDQSSKISCRGNQTNSLISLGKGSDSHIDTYQNSINNSPVAIAGSNQYQTIGRFLLNGYRSFDVDGDPLSYNWTVLQSEPGSNPTIENADSQIASVRLTTPGTYKFSLSVSDSNLTSQSSFQVEVYNRDQLPRIQSMTANKGLCLVVNDGEVYCYGDNANGELGFGNTTPSHSLKQVDSLVNISDIQLNANHTCAIDTNQKLFCFGSNSYGQLGTGNSIDSLTPKTVPSLNNTIQVALGEYHTCALNKSGEVHCFGYNANGQLGNSSNASSLSPTRVPQLSNVQQIVAGKSNTCALQSDGNVKCFGYNAYRTLGDSTTTQSTLPVYTNLPPNKVTNLYSGDDHTCALTKDQELWCFGKNSFGQLGIPSNTISKDPFKIDHPYSIKKAYLGATNTCFVDQNNSLFCAGQNSQNQFVNNDKQNLFSFTQIKTKSNVSHISLGNTFNCVISENSLNCNGTISKNNNRFETIDNFRGLSNSYPVAKHQINRNESLGAIYIDSSLSYDLDSAISYNWTLTSPNGSSANLSHPNSKSSSFIADVIGSYQIDLMVSDGLNSNSSTHSILVSNQSIPVPIQISSNNHSCIVFDNGDLQCFGDGSSKEVDYRVERSFSSPIKIQVPPITKVATGNSHTCYIDRNDDLYCYGSNAYGQLGNSTTLDVNSPSLVAGNQKWKDVSGGDLFTCGVTLDSKAYCWGYGSSGRLGNGLSASSNIPVKVSFESPVIEIQSAEGYSCLMDSDRSISCFGTGSYGQLGNGASSTHFTPQRLNFMNQTVRNYSVSDFHSCAVLQNRKIACWGRGADGRLGQGVTNKLSPTIVPEVNDALKVATGRDHSCYINTNNDVACFGSNTQSQLGQFKGNLSPSPRLVSLLSKAKHIEAGKAHTCIINVNNQVECFGDSTSGATGTGLASQHKEPRLVLGIPSALAQSLPITIQRRSDNYPGSIKLDVENSIYSNNASYSWSIINKPSGSNSTISTANLSSLNFNADKVGTYICSIEVTDQGLVSNKSIQIDIQPKVHIKQDLTVLTNQSIDLSKFVQVTASSLGVNYDWQVKQKPSSSTAVLTAPNNLSSFLTPDLLGQYKLQLKASYASKVLTYELRFNSQSSGSISSYPILISAYDHSCFVMDDKSAQCIGRGINGQLGNGSSVSSDQTTAVINLNNVRQLDVNISHSCAVLNDGSAKCWGNNSAGKLGDSSSVNRLSPTTVDGLQNTVKVATGGTFSCFLNSRGTIQCTGQNNYGQLGIGNHDNASLVKTVANIKNAIDIHAGDNHACAVLASGEVQCWGRNNLGQLGLGHLIDQSTPQATNVINGRSVTLGANHSCINHNDNTLSCFGNNQNGQLGISDLGNKKVPSKVPGFSNIQTVMAKQNHTCFITNQKDGYCFGDNSVGQLGISNIIDQSSPQQIIGLQGIQTLALGRQSTCAIIESGGTLCTGSNSYNQFGKNLPSTLTMSPSAYHGPIADNKPHSKIEVLNTSHLGSIQLHAKDTYLSNQNSYIWSITNKPNGSISSISNINGVSPTLLADKFGTYAITLQTTTSKGSSQSQFKFEITPTINLGEDQTFFSPQSVLVKATSNAPSNVPGITYGFSVLNGPSSPSVDSSSSLSKTINFDSVGDYLIQVSMSDSNVSTSDTQVITITSPSNLGVLKDFSITNNHSCSLNYQGNIYCAGYNSANGKLGNGSSANFSTPQAITSTADFMQVKTGLNHSCAISTSNELYCYGLNSHNQLGVVGADKSIPTFTGVTNVIQVALGDRHTCALKKSGSISCFGDNTYGQLGTNSTVSQATAAPVSSESSFIYIDASTYQTCALRSDGKLFCFGDNSQAQLGLGHNVSRTVPSPMKNQKLPAIDIAMGSNHTCVLYSNQTMDCFGAGASGKLGHGDDANHWQPVTVPKLTGILQIDAGNAHTCATLMNGDAYCFGSNTYGQLGHGTTKHSFSPKKVILNDKIIKASLGTNSSCFHSNKGLLYCFGKNDYGQFGNSNTIQSIGTTTVSTYSLFPNLAPRIEPIADQTRKLGPNYFSAQRVFDPNHQLFGLQWQLTSKPSLSISTFSNPTSFITSVNFDKVGLYTILLSASDGNSTTSASFNVTIKDDATNRATQIYSYIQSCIQKTSGQLDCFGDPSYKLGSQTAWEKSKTPIQQMDINSFHSCAILKSNQLECIGTNAYGQLGLGNKVTAEEPTVVSTEILFTQVSTGLRHSCAVSLNKDLYCFGSNLYGELGTGDLSESLIPKKVLNLSNVIEVQSGQYFTCALKEDGSLSCFGYNSDGQLGQGDTLTRSTPQLISKEFGSVIDFSVGRSSTCFINHLQQTYCFGLNNQGQLGQGHFTKSLSPVEVITPGKAKKISMTYEHTCIVNNSGDLYCFGNNNASQISTRGNIKIASPIKVPLVEKVATVETGLAHTCTILQSGKVLCFGNDTKNELGDGITTDQNNFAVLPDYYKTNNHIPRPILNTRTTSQIGQKVIANSFKSFDLDLDPLTFSFTLIKPNGSSATILQISSQVASFVPDISGDYQINLSVSDQNSTTSTSRNIYVSSPNGKSILNIALGKNTCVVYNDQTVDCSGVGSLNESSRPITQMLTSIVDIADGLNHTCLLHQNKEVSCFGNNSYKQIGHPSLSSTKTPLKVAGLSDVKQLALGDRHSCALQTDGTVKCWGSNSYYQLGHGSTSTANSAIPSTVANLKDIIKIKSHGYHSCGLSKDKKLYCWGYGSNGEFSNGLALYVPSATHSFKQIENITDFSVGNEFTCVQNSLGKIFCSGSNSKGQLGDGSFSKKLNASSVININQSIQITSGHSHTCSLQKNNQLYCFGAGEKGQIANANMLDSNVAINTSGLVNISKVIAGENHTCAVLADQKIACFGESISGNLLSGVSDSSYQPKIASVLPYLTNQAPQIKHYTLAKQSHVELNASNSIDLDNDSLVFNWTIQSSPSNSNASVLNSTSPIAILTNPINGTYQILLSVTDNTHTKNNIVLTYNHQKLNLPVVTNISSSTHNCITLDDGSLQCFGRGFYGQLGTNLTSDFSVPTSVFSTHKFLTVEAGVNHSCGISENKDLYCFGRGAMNQLGQADSTDRHIPTKVLGLSNVYQVAIGDNHTCALTKNGEVYCFGQNSYAQLAQPVSQSTTSNPSQVEIDNVKKITGGPFRTCAIQSDNYAKCWGYQANNQLGNGSSVSYQEQPSYFAPQLGELLDISNGGATTCAVTKNNQVYCVGAGASGQLGNGTKISNTSPQRVTNISDAISISSGQSHTCVLHKTNKVSCFGNNSFGQTGDLQQSPSLIASTILAPENVVKVEAGLNHTCMILQGGDLSCFGKNQYGSLGIGSTLNSITPKRVFQSGKTINTAPIADAGINQIQNIGPVHLNATASYDLNLDQLTYQWSVLSQPNGSSVSISNSSSAIASFNAAIVGTYTISLQVSDSLTSASDVITVNIITDPADRNIINFSATNHTCTVLQSKNLECFGSGSNGQLGLGDTSDSPTPSTVLGFNDAIQVATGQSHTCAITSDNRLKCFGNNSYGQFGNNGAINSHIPVTIPNVTQAIKVTAGDRFTCILNKNGSVFCTGTNSYGELGNGSTQSSVVLTQVQLNQTAVNLYSANSHSCAVLADRSLSCWGYNASGQLGDQTSITRVTPVTATTFKDISKVTIGNNHTCVIRQNNDAYCFGDNSLGQAGAGYVSSTHGEITKVRLNNVKDIAAGHDFTCASTYDGNAACFGNNTFGQLGTNDFLPRFYPSQLRGISDVIKLTAGNHHTCLLQTNNRLSCFGRSDNSRLANSSNVHTNTIQSSNYYPVSNATKPQAILQLPATTGVSNVYLDGSHSFNPSINPLSYHFSIISSPVGANSVIQSNTSSKAYFNADTPGNYEISLTVSSNGFSDSQTRSMYIQTIQETIDSQTANTKGKVSGNLAPVAVLNINTGSKRIYISANQSYDPEGDSLSYQFEIQKDGLILFPQYLSQSIAYIDVVEDGLYQTLISVSDGDKSSQAISFTQITQGNKDILSIRSDYHSCFKNQEEDLYCFGPNQSKQISDLNLSFIDHAILVAQNIEEYSLAGKNTCYVNKTKTLKCIGSLKLSNESQVNLTDFKLDNVKDVASNDNQICYLGTNNSLNCSKSSKDNIVFDQVDLKFSVKSIDSNQGVMFVKDSKDNGFMLSYTAENYQLEDESKLNSLTNKSHVCQLVGSKASCKGEGLFGQLGNGLLEDSIDYQDVSFFDPIQNFQLAQQFNCVLSNKKVFCFGNNLNGQLGISSNVTIQPVPVQIDY